MHLSVAHGVGQQQEEWEISKTNKPTHEVRLGRIWGTV
jgi:hypothetical protein